MKTPAKIKLFFFGVITAFGALLIEMIASIIFPKETAFLFQEITFLLIVFVIIEEVFKLAVIWKASSALQNAKDFFVGAYLIGLGFSLTEIILAGLSAASGKNFSWLPLLGIFIIHTATCIFWGYAIFKKKGGIKHTITLAFFATAILHLIYNSIIIYSTSSAIIIVYLLILCALAFVAAKRLLPA
jgi:hypothetical protein